MSATSFARVDHGPAPEVEVTRDLKTGGPDELT